MTPFEIGLLGLAALLVLLAIRVPVGLAMMIVGFVGHWILQPGGALPSLGTVIMTNMRLEALAILPLFVLMGNFAGVSRE